MLVLLTNTKKTVYLLMHDNVKGACLEGVTISKFKFRGKARMLYITLLNCNDNCRFLQHEGLSNTHSKARERL